MPSNRRAFLAATAVGALAAAPAGTKDRPGHPHGRPHGRPHSAGEALDELLAGNRRYAAGRPRHPRTSRDRRRLLAAGQHPFAVVMGCVDSRVPPELVFDQGLGDLLCTRTAGQVLDEAVLGSLQYGVEELGVPLVLVLGHERCGAVGATLRHIRTGAPAPGHLALLVDEIAPAAHRARALPGDWAEHTTTAHTAWVRDALRADPAFAGATVLGPASTSTRASSPCSHEAPVKLRRARDRTGGLSPVRGVPRLPNVGVHDGMGDGHGSA